MHRDKVHTLLLVGSESLIERLPRVDEPFEIGGSFSQGIGASAHELDRIKVMLTGSFCLRAGLCNPAVSSLGSGTNGLLYGRPIFRLLRRQLQHGLGDAKSRIGQDVDVSWGQPPMGRALMRIALRISRA